MCLGVTLFTATRRYFKRWIIELVNEMKPTIELGIFLLWFRFVHFDSPFDDVHVRDRSSDVQI